MQNKYIYKIYFKLNGDTIHRYKMQFEIIANDNKQATAKGRERWQEQTQKRQRLQKAEIIKTTCRKQETKPRRQKVDPIKKALAEINKYLFEELNK